MYFVFQHRFECSVARSEDCSSSAAHSSTGTSQGIGSSSSSGSGLQGIYIEKLPQRSDATVKKAIGDALKKHGRIVEVRIENNNADQKRALVIFQRVSDLDRLLNESGHLCVLGSRIRVKSAPSLTVIDAYNEYLTMNSQVASGTSNASSSSAGNADKPSESRRSNREPSSSSSSSDEVSVFSSKASRTLYVGGLEFRTTEESLRQRFSKLGDILEIDVKNPESPKPFAFIQFSDIDAVCRAINSSRSESKKDGKKDRFTPNKNPNFGRSLQQPKLWIGRLPPSVTEEYVVQKLKTLADGVTDVVVDMRIGQAIVIFSKSDYAANAYTRIRQGKPKPL
ncbi:hypothetical protein WR25_04428 [Diploscapter pachys]|uniref:RRM domain-containing protein n=1 Tax=Diploscapter pachys TaxID=2018661 RepID=A0A2A2LGH2_9BILA|nr:hypothetical protein WR25_04428 [Diploscapter pachys]